MQAISWKWKLHLEEYQQICLNHRKISLSDEVSLALLKTASHLEIIRVVSSNISTRVNGVYEEAALSL